MATSDVDVTARVRCTRRTTRRLRSAAERTSVDSMSMPTPAAARSWRASRSSSVCVGKYQSTTFMPRRCARSTSARSRLGSTSVAEPGGELCRYSVWTPTLAIVSRVAVETAGRRGVQSYRSTHAPRPANSERGAACAGVVSSAGAAAASAPAVSRARRDSAGAAKTWSGHPECDRLRAVAGLVGAPVVALGLAGYLRGVGRGWSAQRLGEVMETSLPPAAVVILVTGVSGAFARVDRERCSCGRSCRVEEPRRRARRRSRSGEGGAASACARGEGPSPRADAGLLPTRVVDSIRRS